MHIDWNQASIDSNNVCRDGGTPGDYVQWDPKELAYLHDWNVIFVPDGTNFQQIVAAQRLTTSMPNKQPTAIVYRTTKGWLYGIEGKASHGAGHAFCSDGFYHALAPFVHQIGGEFPRCESGEERCKHTNKTTIEQCYWESLEIIRKSLEDNKDVTEALASRLVASRERLNKAKRNPRPNAPTVDALHAAVAASGTTTPDELKFEAGSSATLRGALGTALNVLNKASNGSILAASADLAGSTSLSVAGKGFPDGFYNADTNADSRLLSVGGICEDAMSGILAGISSYGHHVGACSSYGSFIGALGHISSRLHAIGAQARQQIQTEPYNPYILICAHAGLKTGEDGPTHADPQPLQLLQDNFPKGTVVTMTPWDPQEVWPLLIAGLAKRPAVIVPFVTRPNETVIDREALGLAPPSATATGVYALRKAKGKSDGAIVLQGSEVAYAFVKTALPLLEKESVDLDVFYVSSAELFSLLPAEEQEKIYPDSIAQKAMGITGFTLPTLYRWIRSDRGVKSCMHPFQQGHFLGSGPGDVVLAEAGLDGKSQFKAILEYVKA
jgi:transketolase